MVLEEKAILLSLVQGVEGKAWALDLEGWDRNYGDSVCSWEGIECDPADQITVIGIDLRQMDLVATIPSELGQLTTLRNIDLQQNLVHGTIPTEVAGLPHLESFILTKNQITGTLPTFSSPLLQTIDVGHNSLVGTIPDDIGERHERMTEFSVMNNQLSGTIPDSFSKAKLLDSLALSENEFSGTLPSNLGNAMALRYLYLDNNFLMGTIPFGLARIDSPLAEIWLQENLLSGTVPATIADLDNLFNFYVDGNKFTGTVPEELCREDLNSDFYNEVTDDADRNYCDSVACPVGHVSLEGVFPCVPCEEKHYNPYLGRIGQCIDLEQHDILQILYESTEGNDWTNSVSWDNEDHCTFAGVTCDKNKNVVALSLKGNNLRGTIPEEIGFLRYLERLDLSDNHLTGFLPSDLRWAPLDTLDISGNQLIGIVPPTLCLKGGINGNGEQGEFGCEHIACPAGTFSTTGVGVAVGDGEKCMPCEGGTFLANKECAFVKGKSARNDNMGAGAAFGIFVLVVSALGFTFFMGKKISKRYQNRDRGILALDDDFIDLASMANRPNEIS